MARLLDQQRHDILEANRCDTQRADPEDRALYDRLVLNDAKIDAMIRSLDEVREQPDPVGVVRSETVRPNGLQVQNVTSPFGTILIIYESRPDVTIEATCLALKAGNRILLKGGKEALHSNRILVACWHQALQDCGLPDTLVQFLELDRSRTQAFLKSPDQPVDLIVPRGGDRLIQFVKQHATCPVLVSGRGNNFAYVHPSADWEMACRIIINAKTDKISACNALDKVLLDRQLPDAKQRLRQLIEQLSDRQVQVVLDEPAMLIWQEQSSSDSPTCLPLSDPAIWYEEFLAMKLVIGMVAGPETAIDMINQFSGGHSATILASEDAVADSFLQQVDCAAVYHNASTRFTDGGQLGAGAELAISTDKLHHRGPLGLQQLVTNKYLIRGTGQTR